MESSGTMRQADREPYHTHDCHLVLLRFDLLRTRFQVGIVQNGEKHRQHNEENQHHERREVERA